MSSRSEVAHLLPFASARLLFGCWLAFSVLTASPQTTTAAPRRIFVGSFNKTGDAELRKNLIKELAKSKAVQLVESPATADAILAGNSELFVRGYYSLYARAGSSPGHGQPLYGGYTSVELKTPSGETLWSYLATLREATTDPSHELSRDIAKHLLQSGISTPKK